MLVIVAPGQGSQTPGFLAPWLELPGVREHLEALSQAAGLDLVAHGTQSDADTIRDTAIAQPLLVGAGLLTWQTLFSAADIPPAPEVVGATAGHSVGEITAAGAAGVLTPEQAMSFVATRGRGMAQAAAITPTGMSAVIGGDPEDVLAVIERHGLTPANINGANQVVAAGTMDQLAALSEDQPERTRVIPLQVAGAFHTHHMAPAVDQLDQLAATITPGDPLIPLLSNSDGAVVDTGAAFLSRLVRQVANPVRWDLTMENFASMGVTGLIELTPAGTLVGLARRALKGVETLALKTPDDLDSAYRMIREHGGQHHQEETL